MANSNESACYYRNTQMIPLYELRSPTKIVRNETATANRNNAI